MATSIDPKDTTVMVALNNLKTAPLTGGGRVLTTVTQYIKGLNTNEKKKSYIDKVIRIITTQILNNPDDKIKTDTHKRLVAIKLNTLIATLREKKQELQVQDVIDPKIITIESQLGEYVTLIEEANKNPNILNPNLVTSLKHAVNSTDSVKNLFTILEIMVNARISGQNEATTKAAREILDRYKGLPHALSEWLAYFDKLVAMQDAQFNKEWEAMEKQAYNEAEQETEMRKNVVPDYTKQLSAALARGEGSGKRGDQYFTGGRRKTRRHRKRRRKTRKQRKKKKTRRKLKKRHRRTMK